MALPMRELFILSFSFWGSSSHPERSTRATFWATRQFLGVVGLNRFGVKTVTQKKSPVTGAPVMVVI